MNLVLVIRRRLFHRLEGGHVGGHDGHLGATKLPDQLLPGHNSSLHQVAPFSLLSPTAHLFIRAICRYHGDRVSALRRQFMSWDGYGCAFLGDHGDGAAHGLQVCLGDTDLTAGEQTVRSGSQEIPAPQRAGVLGS